VAAFRPTKSQRRIRARWLAGPSRLELGPATWSEEKLALFNRHKQGRGLAQSDGETDALGYVGWLVQSCFHTLEMRYYWEDRLVGVGIVDLGERSASSVYFYFDPDAAIARLGPGVFSILAEIDLCLRTGRDWLYLGLYVEDCRHLAYKADYSPHERFAEGAWRRHEGTP
jgi:arginine-tRNA-protein transferase